MSRSLIALAICGSLLTSNIAQAFPTVPNNRAAVTASSLSQTVDYRGYRGGGYRGGYRGYRNRGNGLGIAAAIIGGVIIAGAATDYSYRRYRRSGDGAFQRCADTYRSFDARSGTYLGYDGERHVCPYLR